ncbi:MAG: TetR/AcrR family transcriptional regulator [Anaeroplasma sp.]|nr:TetR/AcrR family transcriptional regulator [Anaeroplasma sp.]
MPKSKEKCKKIREETKAKILSETIKFFSINGFDGTKISDFAKSLGIAQGTMYRYFESKEELFNEVLKIANNEKEKKNCIYLKLCQLRQLLK